MRSRKTTSGAGGRAARAAGAGCRGVLVGVALALACFPLFGPAQEPAFAPDTATAPRALAAEEIEAAFLYHFGAYVTWPSDPADEWFTIAVLNTPRVARELRRIAAGRRVHGRAVRVQEISFVRELEDAQILFIGDAADRGSASIMDALADRPILIVTQSEDGLGAGAMINFLQQERQVRFEISLPTVRRAGLSISSRLLAVALKVETNGAIWPLEPRHYGDRFTRRLRSDAPCGALPDGRYHCLNALAAT
jgi:hypothetical protein